MLDVGTRLDRRIVSPTAGTINMSSHQGLGWITASSGDTFDWRVKNWRAVLSKELADVIVSGCRRSTRGPTSIGRCRCPPARIADTPVHGARCTVHGADDSGTLGLTVPCGRWKAIRVF